jgi:hypothetical protein
MKPEWKIVRSAGTVSPAGEISGAPGDLGTLLPYVLATI